MTLGIYPVMALMAAVSILIMYAAVSDIHTMKIRNWVSITMVGLALARAVLAPDTIDPVMDLVWAGSVFAIGVAIWHIKPIFGAGDVKLISAFMLWAGSAYGFEFLVATAIAGGVASIFVVLVVAFLKIFDLQLAAVRRAVPALSYDAAAPILKRAFPYGVAICVGAHLVLYYQALSWGVF